MYYLRVIIFLILLMFSWQITYACECGKRDSTILGNFEQSDVVVIAKAVSVEEVPKVESRYAEGKKYEITEIVVKSTKMVVEKVYKGNLKIGDEMIFGQGKGGGSCLWEFSAQSVGGRYLFYLDTKEKKQNLWFMNMCSRSTGLSGKARNGADDLLFLENADKARHRTRISGTIFAAVFSAIEGHYAEYRVFSGLKVRITGNGKTYETKTNKDGVYEIYDLPEGSYKIQPETPKNWKIDIYGGQTIWFGNRQEAENLQVTLKARKQAFYDFHLDLDNKISGKVFDLSGKPLEDVCPQLILAEGETNEEFIRHRTDCTKKDGSFEIKQVPQGNYKLVINRENKITSRYPFNTVYFPNVSRFEEGAVITINNAEDIDGIEIRVSEIRERITLNGTFISSDGVPVEYASINFVVGKDGKDTTENIWTTTDKNGKFSIKFLKGLEGKLSGLVNLDLSQFKNCPDLLKIISEKDNNYFQKKNSNILEIKADQNFEDVKLKLPFPSCNKNRIVNQREY